MTTKQHVHDVRRGTDRGTTRLAWLNGRHSFSFGRYHDPARMGFGPLRVFNDDVIAPGGGFGEHGHDNMEIITWVLDGAVAHRDSTGEAGVLRPGDVQLMRAGGGIRHSEMNASATEPAHLLQIWIEPDERDLPPAYAQRTIPADARRNRWTLLVSPDGREQSMLIHQDARLSVADLDPRAALPVGIVAGRRGYLHVATGAVEVDRTALAAGDAMTFAGPFDARVSATEASEILLFDLA